MATRLQLALGASLLLNLFAVGALGGGLLALQRQEEPSRPAMRPIRAAGEDLPAADRARFDEAMRHALLDGRDLRRTARRSRREAAALFGQSHFDQAAVAALLDRARAADLALRARLEAAALDVAATLPPGERMVLAEGLSRRGPLRRPAP